MTFPIIIWKILEELSSLMTIEWCCLSSPGQIFSMRWQQQSCVGRGMALMLPTDVHLLISSATTALHPPHSIPTAVGSALSP